jgi:hypothetical protein
VNKKTLPSSLLLLSLLTCLLARHLPAQTTAGLTGIWRGREFSVPVDYRETYFSNSVPNIQAWASKSYSPTGYVLVDIWLKDYYRAAPKNFTVAGDGTTTGNFNGRIGALGNGLVEAAEPGNISFGHVCTSNDVMVFLSRDVNGPQDLFLGVRAPDTLQTAELAGVWNTTLFRTPAKLVKTFYNTNTMTTRIGANNDVARTHEFWKDVYFEEPWSLDNLALTFTANGAISGPVTGTAAPQPDRSVILNVDGDSVFCSVNNSKDVMVFSGISSGSQELGVMVKAPDSLAVADLAGTWRVAGYRSPNKLVKNYWNRTTSSSRTVTSHNGTATTDEVLVDVYFRDVAEVEHGFLQITLGGAVSGLSAGAITVGGSGGVTFSENGVGDLLNGRINASKTLIVFSEVKADTQLLLLLLKVSAASPNLETLRQTQQRVLQQADELKVFWVPDSNLELQQATKLGSWTSLPDTRGTGQGTVSTRGLSGQFFRIVQPTN